MVNYSIDWVLSDFQYYNRKYGFGMMDLIETGEGSKRDPWLEKIASVQHIAVQFKVEKGRTKTTFEERGERGGWQVRGKLPFFNESIAIHSHPVKEGAFRLSHFM